LHYSFAVHITTKQKKGSDRKELKREQEIGGKKQKQSSKRVFVDLFRHGSSLTNSKWDLSSMDNYTTILNVKQITSQITDQ
jgi:hypothetical protein